ncbi:MAG: RNA methyltransferase [Lachnospiraceae bacterium]|nr:RNA methyltransferase [Lachnospiraceae bacterium]
MITSTSNSKIKNLNKCLKNAKERRKQDIFLVEGLRMFAEIPQHMHVETYATEEFYHSHRELFKEISFELVADHVMDTISDTRTPQGVVSIVKRKHYEPEEVCRLDTSMAPLILAIENLQDPGNLGTIVRTAEGAGVTGIFMSRDTVDIYNPKVVRSTMGSIFRVPFCYVENLTQQILELNRKGCRTYSAHTQGTSFYDEDYCYPTIFCIGNEGNGLSEALISACNCKISIPMAGKVESLNAATAATVLMYEAMRQRSTLNRQKYSFLEEKSPFYKMTFCTNI